MDRNCHSPDPSCSCPCQGMQTPTPALRTCGDCTPLWILLSSWLAPTQQSWTIGVLWWQGWLTAEPLWCLPGPPDPWVHPGLLAWVMGSRPLGIQCCPAAIGILGCLWLLIAGDCVRPRLPAWRWPPEGHSLVWAQSHEGGCLRCSRMGPRCRVTHLHKNAGRAICPENPRTAADVATPPWLPPDSRS